MDMDFFTFGSVPVHTHWLAKLFVFVMRLAEVTSRTISLAIFGYVNRPACAGAYENTQESLWMVLGIDFVLLFILTAIAVPPTGRGDAWKTLVFTKYPVMVAAMLVAAPPPVDTELCCLRHMYYPYRL